MKVLLVLPEFGDDVPGGIARFYKHAAEGLLRAGHQVDVCVAAPDVEARLINGVRVFGTDRARIEANKSRLSHFHLAPGLRHQLAVSEAAFETCMGGAGYDVVETTDWGYLYAAWLTREPRQAPVVVQFHGSPGQIGYRDPLSGDELSGMLSRMIEVALLPRADDLQTPGEANAREWSEILGRPVACLPPAWPSPPPLRKDMPQAQHGVVAARVQTWKGPHVLCEAMQLLGDAAPKILWVGGDHPVGDIQTSLTEQLRIRYPDVWGKSVIALGSRPPHVTEQMQLEARFVVHPSIWDCFPLAIVEAMALGKVVICAKQAGSSRLIRDGENGFTFDADSPAQLAALIQKVSSTGWDELARIGAEAHRTIGEALDIDSITRLRVSKYGCLSVKDRPRPHAWLETLFGPDRPGAEMQFLDQTPLRKILEYVAVRIRGRLIPRIAQRAPGRNDAPHLDSDRANR